MPIQLPPYFNQNLKWVKFWKDASGAGHDFLMFNESGFWPSQSIPEIKTEFNIKAIVYQYPWFFGQKFWYIPKGPIIDTKLNPEEVNLLFSKLLSQILTQAKLQGVTHLKFDFDDTFTDLINIQNLQDIEEFLAGLESGLKIKTDSKSIQYLQSMSMDISQVQKSAQVDLINPDLHAFFETNKVFWNKTSQKARRYTRRALDLYQNKKWQVSFAKTQKNFELFWAIHSQTAANKEFVTSSKTYLQSLFDQDFSRLVLILDDKGAPHSVWLGAELDRTLVYIFGGNTTQSLEDNGQYLLHLAVMYLGKSGDVEFYDLGGYKAEEGYGKFKDAYKGRIRTFQGPVDLVIKASTYNFVNWLISFKKFWTPR